MIDPTVRSCISRPAIVLGISRGRVHDKPRPVSQADLKQMYRINKLHMEFPFAGSRMLRGCWSKMALGSGDCRLPC